MDLTIKIIIIIVIIYMYFVYMKQYKIMENHIKMFPSYQTILYHYNLLKIKQYINNDCKVISDRNIIYIKNFLNNGLFKNLKEKSDNLNYFRSNVPNRKGGAISKFDLTKLYLNNDFVEPLNLYYSDEFLFFINKLLNKKLIYPSAIDANCCSIIIYDKPGDYIGWHFDFNAYYGDRYTLLLTLYNNSSSEFCYNENYLKTEENSLLIFNGSNLKHLASPIKQDEKRILLAMTLCNGGVLKFNIINFIIENIKEFIFYGIS